MIIDEWTSDDVRTQGGGESPPCAGLASNALPKAQSITSAESSQTGVSTRNARSEIMFQPQKQGEIPHWYVLRCTYGREKKAYNYMVSQGITAFYPTIEVVKLINGKRKKLPNPACPISFSPSVLKIRSKLLFMITQTFHTFAFITITNA